MVSSTAVAGCTPWGKCRTACWVSCRDKQTWVRLRGKQAGQSGKLGPMMQLHVCLVL